MSIRFCLFAITLVITTICSAKVPKAVENQAVNVVRIKVVGERTKPPHKTETKWGTGFYVSESGFILTAGHVISPWFANESRPKFWREGSPRITIFTETGDSPGENAAAIYFDEQVDLGLIKASPKPDRGIELGSYTELLEMADTDDVYALVFGLDNDDVDIRDGRIDTVLALGNNGRVKVSIDDLSESDSGSPLLNDAGRVVGVLSQGKIDGNIGRIAIPMPFAVPMLARAEVRLAREDTRINEIQAVVQELKSEASNFDSQLISSPGPASGWQLSVTFDKRLESGFRPNQVVVDLVLGMNSGREETLGSFDAEIKDIPSRNQAAIISNFDTQLLDDIRVLNDARANNKIRMDNIKTMIVTPIAIWKIATEKGFIDKIVKGQPITLSLDSQTRNAARTN